MLAASSSIEQRGRHCSAPEEFQKTIILCWIAQANIISHIPVDNEPFQPSDQVIDLEAGISVKESHGLTSALLTYSRSNGFAGCSNESRTIVMGETLSL